MQPRHQGLDHGRAFLAGQPPDVLLDRLEVNDRENGRVGQDRRDKGRLDDLDIGNADDLGHDKGGGTHDGRHELAVGGCSHFHGTGHVIFKSHFFHQGDGHGAGGDRVGDGGTRYGSHGTGGHDSRFGRPPPKSAHQGKGEVDQVFAGADFIQEGTEEHEQKYEGGRYPQRNPPQAFTGHEDMVDDPFDAKPPVAEIAGQIGAQKGVK